MVLRSYLESKLSVDDPESNSVSVQGNDKYLSASCVIGEACSHQGAKCCVFGL